MVRVFFEEELKTLSNEIVEMGELIEKAILAAITSITNNDKELAHKTVENDILVNKKERDIEALCLRILMTQQPVASDLRIVSSALKIITDMERIGDQASDICEISLLITNNDFACKEEIEIMGRKCADMVIKAMNAYVTKDNELAKEIITYDDVIDKAFHKCKKHIIEAIQNGKESPENELNVFMIAKYFERIGDHATNIAEWILFSNNGTHNIE